MAPENTIQSRNHFYAQLEKKGTSQLNIRSPGAGGGGENGAEKAGRRWCIYTYNEYWAASTNSDISSVSASNSAEGGDVVSLARSDANNM